MKIVVTGTRGIPGIQGGVETHCEELFPRLVAMGFDITVIRRSCYVDDRLSSFKGVGLKDVYAPRSKAFEAIVHTFLAIVAARRMNADVVHIHAIGPAIMVPFARMLGLKVVMTHHGPDYNRKKWGRIARMILKTGERWGVRFSSHVIVISDVINNLIKERYNRHDATLIFNGVNVPVKSSANGYIGSMGLEPGKYIVSLGRFVAEKGFHDLIDAFDRTQAKKAGYKLVIAGDADHEDAYSKALKAKAIDAGTILPGFIKGERLNELLSNAALFVLPSYHEGLPIALLEAMSYDLDVLTSDIPANMIDELSADDHFPTGDVASLRTEIDRKLNKVSTTRHYDLTRYDWDNIAEQTANVYRLLS